MCESFIQTFLAIVNQVERSKKRKEDNTDRFLNDFIARCLKERLLFCLRNEDYSTGRIITKFLKYRFEFRYLTYIEALKNIGGQDSSRIFYIPQPETLQFFGVAETRESIIRDQLNSLNF